MNVGNGIKIAKITTISTDIAENYNDISDSTNTLAVDHDAWTPNHRPISPPSTIPAPPPPDLLVGTRSLNGCSDGWGCWACQLVQALQQCMDHNGNVLYFQPSIFIPGPNYHPNINHNQSKPWNLLFTIIPHTNHNEPWSKVCLSLLCSQVTKAIIIHTEPTIYDWFMTCRLFKKCQYLKIQDNEYP